jgi:hypothetical protein
MRCNPRAATAEHLDRGELARAVGAEEAEELALGHGERDVVDVQHLVEALGQPLDDDGQLALGWRMVRRRNGGAVQRRRGRRVEPLRRNGCVHPRDYMGGVGSAQDLARVFRQPRQVRPGSQAGAQRLPTHSP